MFSMNVLAVSGTFFARCPTQRVDSQVPNANLGSQMHINTPATRHGG